jgi:hypothetical protein
MDADTIGGRFSPRESIFNHFTRAWVASGQKCADIGFGDGVT